MVDQNWWGWHFNSSAYRPSLLDESSKSHMVWTSGGNCSRWLSGPSHTRECKRFPNAFMHRETCGQTFGEGLITFTWNLKVWHESFDCESFIYNLKYNKNMHTQSEVQDAVDLNDSGDRVDWGSLVCNHEWLEGKGGRARDRSLGKWTLPLEFDLGSVSISRNVTWVT